MQMSNMSGVDALHFHNSLIPMDAYFLLPLESKQEATSG